MASIVTTEASADGRRAAQVPEDPSADDREGRTQPHQPVNERRFVDRGNPFTRGVSQSPVSAMARPEAANSGGVSSTNPVLPSFQQKSAIPRPRMSNSPAGAAVA